MDFVGQLVPLVLLRAAYRTSFVGGPTRMLVCSTGGGLWELIDPLVGEFGFPAADRIRPFPHGHCLPRRFSTKS